MRCLAWLQAESGKLLSASVSDAGGFFARPKPSFMNFLICDLELLLPPDQHPSVSCSYCLLLVQSVCQIGTSFQGLLETTAAFQRARWLIVKKRHIVDKDQPRHLIEKQMKYCNLEQSEQLPRNVRIVPDRAPKDPNPSKRSMQLVISKRPPSEPSLSKQRS